MRRSAILLLSLLVSVISWTYTVSGPQGRVELREQSRGGTVWVCAEDLARAMGGSFKEDTNTGRPVLNVSGQRILLSTLSPVVSKSGQIVHLSHQPFLEGGCLWVPEQVLRLLGIPSSTGQPEQPEPGLPDVPPPPANGQRVDLVYAEDGTRITLKGPDAHKIEWSLQGRILTLEGAGMEIVPGGARLPKGLIEKAEPSVSGRGISVIFVSGFERADSLKLRNPDRLVFVLRGELPASPVTPDSPPLVAGTGTLKPGPLSTPTEKTPELDLVVLDPGHGGSDVGAKGHQGLLEKDITLAICKRMAAELEKSGIQVLLTRSEDHDMPLASRTAYANSHQADVFISVHMNASSTSRALGTETYYHSTEATDQWAKSLAERENTISGFQAQRDGLALVLWDLAQTQYIVESARLAELIQIKFNELLSVRDRGVRQAPFAVLEGAQMPAVLLEVAFITNPKEAELMIDGEFQGRVATTLSAAVMSFKAAHDEPFPASESEE